MVIGIDASRANKKHKTGTEWYAYYLIRNLAKLDSQNQYILYTDRPLTGGLANLSSSDNEFDYDGEEIKFDGEGYQVIKSPHNNVRAKVLRWPLFFFWTLGRLSWEMLWHKPDVLFVPAHTLPLIFPKNTVVTVHDIAFERDASLYGRDDMGAEHPFLRRIVDALVRIVTLGRYGANSHDYLRWSTLFALKRAKKIITVSRFSKKEIKSVYRLADDKIEVIYNGFNKDLFRIIEDKEKIREVLSRYGLEQPYFLYVGRLERKKNTPFMIEAFAAFRDRHRQAKHKLVLVGNVGYGYDEVKYVIKEFNLDNEVVVTGWVEEYDLPYIYAGAEAFIFPTRYEGFGIPVVQAMASGCPTLVSDVPVMREISDDQVVFFNPCREEDLTKAMERVVFNRSSLDKIVKKAQLRAQDFSWNRNADEVLKLLNKL